MSPVSLRHRLQRWLFRVSGPEAAPIELGQRRIFVLPTRFGLCFGLSLLVMLLASINYTLNLGFALVFLLGGIAWISIHHAFRNLVALRITPGRAEAVFDGSPARFGIVFANPALRPRHALYMRAAHGPHSTGCGPFELPAEGGCVQDVHLPTQGRGWLVLPRLTLESRHPLGLIRAWSLFQPELRCLVYPAPEAAAPPLPDGAGEHPGDAGRRQGCDDFAGLRHHQPADSPRHVAWKSVARGGPWHTKEFDGAGAQAVWLDWQDLPAGLDVEQRLSRLTRWVLDADATGLDFGLSLPDLVLPPQHGRAHREACLSALALFGAPR